MSSRVIELHGCNVRKIVPLTKSMHIQFPSLNEFLEDYETLKYHESLSIVEWSAIVQQYTEWFNWNAYGGKDSVLAPIIGTSVDVNTGLPILCFPKFTPIAAENENFLDEYLLIFFGMRAKKLGVSETEMRSFIKKAQQACFDLSLEESDVFSNLTNIGYHPELGLRIIDYGLICM